MARIAVVGLGVMGSAAAGRLHEAGHDVIASDPHPTAPTRAADLGIRFGDLETAARDVDAVVLFLPGPAQVREVVMRVSEVARPATVVVDHSTSEPSSAIEMANLLLESGHQWVDAPVLGRPAAIGEWCLPVGCTEGALGAVEELLGVYASSIIEVGGPGRGHTVKLLNQMMFGAINAMTAEMMAIAERVGVEPGLLYSIITGSRAGTVSNLFVALGQRISDEQYDDATFSMALLEKDIRLGVELARASGIEPRIGAVVAALNEEALEAGLADQDTAALWTMLRSAN